MGSKYHLNNSNETKYIEESVIIIISHNFIIAISNKNNKTGFVKYISLQVSISI